MKKISSREWIKDVMKQAEDDFKNHDVKIIGPGHWRLFNPKRKANLWCDIVVVGERALTVWGDIGSR